MRITDIISSTPVVGARPAPTKRQAAEGPAPQVVPGRPDGAQHPDEVAASALAKAAEKASAARVVAAQNELAASSVRGDRLDETPVP